jgi:hypothetical protein
MHPSQHDVAARFSYEQSAAYASTPVPIIQEVSAGGPTQRLGCSAAL